MRAPFPFPSACLPWRKHRSQPVPQALTGLGFKEAFHAVQGFDAASIAPSDELGQVHATVSRLAVVDPGLWFAQPLS